MASTQADEIKKTIIKKYGEFNLQLAALTEKVVDSLIENDAPEPTLMRLFAMYFMHIVDTLPNEAHWDSVQISLATLIVVIEQQSEIVPPLHKKLDELVTRFSTISFSSLDPVDISKRIYYILGYIEGLKDGIKEGIQKMMDYGKAMSSRLCEDS